MGSHLLTWEMAKQAVEIVLPSILGTMDSGLAKRADLHIVVLDPTILNSSDVVFFQEVILYEYQLGDPQKWEYDYQKIARAKAEVTWKTGLPAQLVQQRRPYLYESGETLHAGSAIYEGIVVACSGVQWYWDQMYAGQIAVVCQGLCIEVMQVDVLQTEMKTDEDFLPLS